MLNRIRFWFLIFALSLMVGSDHFVLSFTHRIPSSTISVLLDEPITDCAARMLAFSSSGRAEVAIDKLRELEDLKSGIWARKTLGDDGEYIEGETIAAVMERKNIVWRSEEFFLLLESRGIPEEFHHLYSFNGELRVPPHLVFDLSLENGQEKLKAIRVNFINRETFTKDLLKDMNELLEYMPGIEVWMVVPEKEIELAEMIIDHMPKRVRRKFKLIPADQSMNVWAQDASKPLADGETTLAQPKGNEVIRDENLVPLRSMQESGLIDVIPSPFAFEGGNIIVGNRHIFVGPDIVRDLSKQFHISRKNAVSVLSEHWNKEVIEIGRPNADGVLEQVDFHIDLSMAIAKAKLGRWEKREEVAIVSSPFMLLEEILGFPPIKNMDRDTYYDKMRELAYKVGYEDFPFKLTHTDKRLLLEMSELSYDDILVEELGYESMVETLVENGYKVVRIPGHNRFDEEQTLRAFNFTNVIFSGKNAIIPRYDSNLLDPYIREYYRKLGFNVVGIRAVQNFICKKGGIRCLSETYRRPVFIKK